MVEKKPVEMGREPGKCRDGGSHTFDKEGNPVEAKKTFKPKPEKPVKEK